MFNNKAIVDQSVARAFNSAGIPFNVINNHSFKQALSEVAKFGPGYSPPSEFNLRAYLLEKEVSKVSAVVKTVVMNDLHTTGCAIVSDGWSNIKNKPIINEILVCTKGELFLDSTDTSGDKKTSKFIADKIIKQINLLGASNIIQVITDSAANCKGRWPLICVEYPHITCGPCTAHFLDLLLEDLSKIEWIKNNFKEGRDIVTFITTHHQSLALFRNHSTLQLLKPYDTRFSKELVSQSHLLQVKDSLQETVVDKKYKSWLLKNKSYKDGGMAVSARLLDESWWTCTAKVVKLCEPIVAILRLMDAGGRSPAIGKVYFRMFEIIQNISKMNELSEEDYSICKQSLGHVAHRHA